MNDKYVVYYNYLKERSKIGLWYRKLWLYPQICKHIRGRVLDIGCGIGDLLDYKPTTIGVDINPLLVEHCIKRGHRVLNMSDDQLPFKRETFSSAFLDNVLEHIEKPERLIREIHRVLDEGGVLIVGVPCEKGYSSDPDHKIFYEKSNLRDVFESRGFAEMSTRIMPLNIPILGRLISPFCLYSTFVKCS